MPSSCGARERFLQLSRRGSAAWLLAALIAARASAQIDPDDTGAGTKLGLAQLGNSGQVGTVTLLERRTHTLVLLDVRSTRRGAVEPARIRRGHRCRAVAAPQTPVIALTDLHGGISRSDLGVPASKLLSGNYVVEVFASAGSLHRVSCGELHR